MAGPPRPPHPAAWHRGPITTIRAPIADDQEMVRRGLRPALENQPDVTVAGEAANGVATPAPACELRPDTALVDVRMPGPDGPQVTRRLAGGPEGVRRAR